ncbi:hypothetical protein [Tolumonas lignilytica]|uniref:hypothetical protein n=1 Tax=Tolumonas lignilytica TaxID=1283284 RepID=UPI000464D1D6|nr:hypothetical protein [Tolumonas lignilytica]
MPETSSSRLAQELRNLILSLSDEAVISLMSHACESKIQHLFLAKTQSPGLVGMPVVGGVQ